MAANPQLTATAQDFATFMARTGKFSHTADGQTPAVRAKAHAYAPCLIAENMASQHHPAGFTTEALAEGFFWPGTQEPTTAHPNHEDRYTIVRGDAGAFQLKPG